MKTTLELPDELLRAAKATAARQGTSLRSLFEIALREHLDRAATHAAGDEPWRRLLGAASAEEVQAVDEAIAAELERVDRASWR